MIKIKGWEITTLGKSCSIEIGGTPSRSNSEYWDVNKETNNFWVSIKDLNKRVITHTAENISDLGVSRSNVKLQRSGTILLSFKLSIGKVSYAGINLYTNEAIAGLRPKTINYEFLFQGLQYWNLVDGVDQAIKGVTLNKEKLNKIAYIYPRSLKEQAQIATILSTIDKAIEQTEAIITKQQRIKTGLMQDLLTRGIDKQGNIRSEDTHDFKDSPMGRIPVEWNVNTLSSPLISEFITSGSRGWAKYYSVEGAKFLRIGNLTREHINLRYDDIVYVTLPDTSEGKRTSVKKGDILISITADLGIVGVIADNYGEAYVNQHIALVRPSNDIDNSSRFIAWFISSRYCQKQIEKINESGAKAGLNLPTLGSLLIPIPEKKEMNRISDLLDEIVENIVELQEILSKLQRTKTGLMQDLLTGKVRVIHLLKENANH